ncbi:MAG: hemolysin, partial [Bacteroidales bacterium]|nr:hemolysin [Bacteroidales bacterium]
YFGKFTMYTTFNVEARDIIHHFLQGYFPDKENLVFPFEAVEIRTPKDHLDSIFTFDNYDEDFKKLIRSVRNLDENVPPLVNAYMNLSSTMKTFGTSMNPGFGDVEETGILITIADIFPAKIERHMKTYKQGK